MIVPHQKGLDLHYEPKKEADLFNELEELRNKLKMV